ncbi:MAG: hypothetical protein ABSA79_08990 [Candidatus Bathyarchaeia archaeon]|jgi:hypothetical protein
MKKSFVVVFGMIILCILLMVPIAYAINSAYSYTDYEATSTHVEDGKWTTPDEWTDAMTISPLVSGFSWRASWTYPSDIVQHFIIEDLTDTTNDTGDIVNVCYDTAASGGAAPQPADFKIELVGDRTSGLSLYRGNGTGWAKFTGWTATDAAVGVSFSASPLSSTPHLIVEFMVDKSTIADVSGSGYQPGIYVSAYDASNSAAGVLSWPPAPGASANVPDSWGLEMGTTSTIPESLTIGAVALLSIVAIAVSFYLLPKRPKLRIKTTGKIE